MTTCTFQMGQRLLLQASSRQIQICTYRLRAFFENCFCVDMETNISDNYSFSVDKDKASYLIDCKENQWNELFEKNASAELIVTPESVSETTVRVNIPENLSAEVAKSSMWDEYDSRCINCGRCNFVCPTCTCFTMQKVYSIVKMAGLEKDEESGHRAW